MKDKLKTLVTDELKDIIITSPNSKKSKTDDDLLQNVFVKGSTTVIETGVETVKSGIFSILDGILYKIVGSTLLIVLILTAGCVGANIAVDSLSSTPTEIPQ